MAAKYDGDSWLELQRMREEKMRYEVLLMLYEAAGGKVDCDINCWSFAVDLGVWHTEIFRVVEFLDRKGYVRYRGAGPVVCLTAKGADCITRSDDRRRSIRD
jgi:hypothetical protein